MPPRSHGDAFGRVAVYIRHPVDCPIHKDATGPLVDSEHTLQDVNFPRF